MEMTPKWRQDISLTMEKLFQEPVHREHPELCAHARTLFNVAKMRTVQTHPNKWQKSAELSPK